MFYNVAIECDYIPEDLAKDKESVKGYLQKQGRNDLWTELQGLVYGKYLPKARIYPGFATFLRGCLDSGIRVRIISHKTQFNVVGEKTDLRRAAMKWLHQNQIVGAKALRPEDVFFLSTRAEKVRKVTEQACEVFIDDLPEVFLEPGFPSGVRRILFGKTLDDRLVGIECAGDWQTAQDMILTLKQ